MQKLYVQSADCSALLARNNKYSKSCNCLCLSIWLSVCLERFSLSMQNVLYERSIHILPLTRLMYIEVKHAQRCHLHQMAWVLSDEEVFLADFQHSLGKYLIEFSFNPASQEIQGVTTHKDAIEAGDRRPQTLRKCGHLSQTIDYVAQFFSLPPSFHCCYSTMSIISSLIKLYVRFHQNSPSLPSFML